MQSNPTGRLQPMEPEPQWLPIKLFPLEEEYLQGRSIIERMIIEFSLGMSIEQYNKRFIENGPDYASIERRIAAHPKLTVDLGYTEHGKIGHIVREDRDHGLCGRFIVQVYTACPYDQVPTLCKLCLKKF